MAIPKDQRCRFCFNRGDRILLIQNGNGRTVERRCPDHPDTTGLTVISDKTIGASK